MRISIAGLVALALSSAVAHAADPDGALPIDAGPAVFDWQGFYIGASAGYGWLEDVDYAPPPPFVAPLYDEGDGWIFGAHAGYLHQFGPFVAGFEAQVVKLDITYEGFDFITVENSYLLKGRAGFAFDRLLLTGHVGAAYATTNIDLRDWGRVVGVGIDYAVTDNLIAGVSYDHAWFDEFDGTMIDAHIDLLQARLSFKF